jgi:hypothetical protein
MTVLPYGYETWFVILRKEHGLRVCENRVLRTIFGLDRDELLNEVLPNLYCPPSTIRIITSRKRTYSMNGGE